MVDLGEVAVGQHVARVDDRAIGRREAAGRRQEDRVAPGGRTVLVDVHRDRQIRTHERLQQLAEVGFLERVGTGVETVADAIRVVVGVDLDADGADVVHVELGAVRTVEAGHPVQVVTQGERRRQGQQFHRQGGDDGQLDARDDEARLVQVRRRLRLLHVRAGGRVRVGGREVAHRRPDEVEVALDAGQARGLLARVQAGQDAVLALVAGARDFQVVDRHVGTDRVVDFVGRLRLVEGEAHLRVGQLRHRFERDVDEFRIGRVQLGRDGVAGVDQRAADHVQVVEVVALGDDFGLGVVPALVGDLRVLGAQQVVDHGAVLVVVRIRHHAEDLDALQARLVDEDRRRILGGVRQQHDVVGQAGVRVLGVAHDQDDGRAVDRRGGVALAQRVDVHQVLARARGRGGQFGGGLDELLDGFGHRQRGQQRVVEATEVADGARRRDLGARRRRSEGLGDLGRMRGAVLVRSVHGLVATLLLGSGFRGVGVGLRAEGVARCDARLTGGSGLVHGRSHGGVTGRAGGRAVAFVDGHCRFLLSKVVTEKKAGTSDQHASTNRISELSTAPLQLKLLRYSWESAAMKPASL